MIDQENSLQYDEDCSSVFVQRRASDSEWFILTSLIATSLLFSEEVKKMGKGQEKGKKGKTNKPKVSIKDKKKRKQKKEAA